MTTRKIPIIEKRILKAPWERETVSDPTYKFAGIQLRRKAKTLPV